MPKRSEAPGAYTPRTSPRLRGFSFCRRRQRDMEETIMAKSQMRSNREAKKPKKIREPAAAPTLGKGLFASIGLPKKKG